MERRDNALELSSDEMRTLGYRIVDMMIDHVESLSDVHVATTASREALSRAIDIEMPAAPSTVDDVLERVRSTILANLTHVDHPRFFAYVPGPGNFVGAMAAALSAGVNVFAGSWPVASGPAHVELTVIDWLRRICRLPDGAGGLFVSGGSVANLSALVIARHGLDDDERSRAVVYYSDQAHSSVDRALDVLGVPVALRRVIATGSAFALGAGELASRIASDRAAGLHPWCVVASAGTTSTGAVDELGPIAALCHRERMWLHVDAAYGGGAMLCDEGAGLLAGIGDADSIALDPHKWLFQPFDIGCLLVRDETVLEGTFRHIPAYLRDSAARNDEVNFRDRGIELTRPFRALKLWMTLELFGADAMRAAVGRGLESARVAERRLLDSGLWTIVTGAQLGIVTFRYRLDGASDELSDDVHRRIAASMFADGFALASTTELGGRVCLRLCTINPRTTDDDIVATITRIEQLAGEVLPMRALH